MGNNLISLDGTALTFSHIASLGIIVSRGLIYSHWSRLVSLVSLSLAVFSWPQPVPHGVGGFT